MCICNLLYSQQTNFVKKIPSLRGEEYRNNNRVYPKKAHATNSNKYLLQKIQALKAKTKKRKVERDLRI